VAVVIVWLLSIFAAGNQDQNEGLFFPWPGQPDHAVVPGRSFMDSIEMAESLIKGGDRLDIRHMQRNMGQSRSGSVAHAATLVSDRMHAGLS